jgi:ABC-type sugar transport system permease subunit
MAFQNGYSSNLAIGGQTFSFGFENFRSAVSNPDFRKSLLTTSVLCVATVPLSTALALLIAVALNSIKPLQRFLQTIFFLPYVTNSIAIGMVFAAMFNIVGINSTSESVGIINNTDSAKVGKYYAKDCFSANMDNDIMSRFAVGGEGDLAIIRKMSAEQYTERVKIVYGPIVIE